MPLSKGLRVLLVANTDWYLANFRHDLACKLRQMGAQVHLIAPPGKSLDWLAGQGFQTHALKLGNNSYSPLGNWQTLQHIKKLYRQIKPDLAHHFTPRCVVLGSMAARSARVPHVVNALTGLGHVFTSTGFKSRLARPALRWLLKRNLNGDKRAVIFQNQDDMDELVTTGVVDAKCSSLIRGSGVDPDFFQPGAYPHEGDEIRVLFASRLLGEKGIRELVVAMAEVVKKHPNAVLWVAGEPYAQNPTSLTNRDLQIMARQPWLKLFGHVDDMLPLLQQSDIVALPSYREGTPKILLEAASCGLPIVATDIAGCRGVVQEGVNGHLVAVRDSVELTMALLKLCEDAALRRAMGARGRDIILQDFTSEIVIRKTLAVYQSLLSK